MKDLTVYTNSTEFATLDKEQIEKINSRLPEFHRATAMVGHSTSQTSYSLQTLSMMDDSPLSRMKQCLAQINKKYQALEEAYFKIEEFKLEIKNLYKCSDESSTLQCRKKEAQIKTISVSMENALREIGLFQDMYDDIMKNYNIPSNWTEKDFEEQEISNMIRRSFRLAIQDILASGRVSKAAVEFWEQLGINPQLALTITQGYLIKSDEIIKNEKTVSITNMYEFLDKMADQFKDAYKLALKRIGLNELGSESFMAKGKTKPQ